MCVIVIQYGNIIHWSMSVFWCVNNGSYIKATGGLERRKWFHTLMYISHAKQIEILWWNPWYGWWGFIGGGWGEQNNQWSSDFCSGQIPWFHYFCSWCTQLIQWLWYIFYDIIQCYCIFKWVMKCQWIMLYITDAH